MAKINHQKRFKTEQNFKLKNLKGIVIPTEDIQNIEKAFDDEQKFFLRVTFLEKGIKKTLIMYKTQYTSAGLKEVFEKTLKIKDSINKDLPSMRHRDQDSEARRIKKQMSEIRESKETNLENKLEQLEKLEKHIFSEKNYGLIRGLEERGLKKEIIEEYAGLRKEIEQEIERIESLKQKEIQDITNKPSTDENSDKTRGNQPIDSTRGNQPIDSSSSEIPVDKKRKEDVPVDIHIKGNEDQGKTEPGIITGEQIVEEKTKTDDTKPSETPDSTAIDSVKKTAVPKNIKETDETKILLVKKLIKEGGITIRNEDGKIHKAHYGERPILYPLHPQKTTNSLKKKNNNLDDIKITSIEYDSKKKNIIGIELFASSQEGITINFDKIPKIIGKKNQPFVTKAVFAGYDDQHITESIDANGKSSVEIKGENMVYTFEKDFTPTKTGWMKKQLHIGERHKRAQIYEEEGKLVLECKNQAEFDLMKKELSGKPFNGINFEDLTVKFRNQEREMNQTQGSASLRETPEEKAAKLSKTFTNTSTDISGSASPLTQSRTATSRNPNNTSTVSR